MCSDIEWIRAKHTGMLCFKEKVDMLRESTRQKKLLRNTLDFKDTEACLMWTLKPQNAFEYSFFLP